MEKPMTRNVLNRWGFIRVAFAAVVGLPLIIATSAYAQNPGSPPTGPDQGAQAAAGAGAQAGQAAGPGAQAEAERVIVTGSNIPTAEEVGPNPVLALNRDLINKAGEKNTEELLRDLPVANANGVPISNNATGFTPGAASIALRGFDPSATLLLVDGRRIAPYPIGQGGTSSFFDLNSIPLPAVESIEILKDGASTTYGADAVAGVVNIKLYKHYRGAQVTIEYGNTLDKDAAVYRGDVLFGIGDDKVEIAGDINFYHHNSLFNRDRGNSATPPFLSSNASPYNLQLAKAVAAAAGGTAVAGSSAIEFGTPPDLTNGLAPASTYTYFHARPRAVGGPLPGFNFNQFSGSYPEEERWGGYVAFSDKICDDQVVLYGDFYYENTKAHNELAPSATGSFFTPGQKTIAIPPHMSLGGVAPPNTPVFQGQPCPPADPGCNATNTPLNAFNPFNPFNQIISGGSRARLADFGNRLFDDNTDSVLFTLGVKGDKLFDGNWGYDAGFRYSQITVTENGRLQSVSRFNRILNANDTIFQPGSSDYIGTTIPYDPFNDFRVPVATNIPTLKFATVHPKNVDTNKITELDTNIYSTDLFDVPAGGVAIAFGGQFRRENLDQSPDQLNLEGDIIGSSATAITHAGRKDFAFYGETRVPLFSPEMGIWGLHNVEVTGAARFEDFENNNSNVLVPKVGLRWQPFNDELTIRSTWGEGFREPSLVELFGSPTFGLTPTSTSNVPASRGGPGVTEPETATEISSNPTLQPERSRAWTGGVVYTPKWVEKVISGGSLTMSIDLWDIERKGVVTSPSSQEVVARCKPDLTTDTCTGNLLPGEVVQIDPATGGVNFVKTAQQNAGRQNATGADFGLQYTQQTKYGTFSWYTDAAYLNSFIFQSTTRAKGVREAGLVANSLGGDAWVRWKARSVVDWTWHNFDMNWTLHYTDGFHEFNTSPSADPAHHHYVKQTWFFDNYASYDLIFTPPVESQPVAGYSKGGKEVMTSKEGKQIESTAAYTMPCWKTILNNSTIYAGCNDVFGADPPKMYGFGYGNSNNYPGFMYDNLGRFWYVGLKKKF
jgi:iron complex outermembrane receptor protein